MTLTTVALDATTGAGPKPALYVANHTADDAMQASSRRITCRRDMAFSASSGFRRAATGVIDEY